MDELDDAIRAFMAKHPDVLGVTAGRQQVRPGSGFTWSAGGSVRIAGMLVPRWGHSRESLAMAFAALEHVLYGSPDPN